LNFYAILFGNGFIPDAEASAGLPS